MKNFDLKNVDCHATLAMTKSGQSGRSMIEMLGVLAIIGVLSVGGIAGYSKAMTKYRINKAIEQITLIAGNVRTFFAPQGNYKGFSCSCGDSIACGHWDYATDQQVYDGCPIIKKAKLIPDEMLTINSSIGKMTAMTNAFGERIGVFESSKAKSGDDQAFAITYHIGNNVEACIELMTYDWASINAKAIGAPFEVEASMGYLKTPVSIETAVAKCDGIANDDYYITFYFDVDVDSEVWKNRF